MNDSEKYLIEYEDSRGKYTLLETIIIISAYCASRNNEKSDEQHFGEPDNSKKQRKSVKTVTASKVGKT